MLRRRRILPPTQFTLADKVRLAMGVVILTLGIVLLWRMLPLGLTPPALVVCAAFIGFGSYRLWLGYTRLSDYYQGRATKSRR